MTCTRPQAKSQKNPLTRGRRPHMTQCMVRPCVARDFVDLAGAVLHQCIRSLIGAYRGSRPSWISARVRSRYRTGLNGPFGSPVFACAGKTDPPFRLILSQTSAVDAVGSVIDSSSFEPFLCSCLAAIPSSRPAHADAPRARGRQGWPSRWSCLSLLSCQATP